MSSNYETLYILRPDLTEEQVQQEVNKYRDFLNDYETEELQVKVWGKRRLAYPIKKQQDGVYVQMNYTANGKQVAPMERAMRLSDEVIRYLTLKVDKEIVQVQPTSSQPEEKPTQPSPAPTPPVALEPSIPVAISAEEDDLISAEDE